MRKKNLLLVEDDCLIGEKLLKTASELQVLDKILLSTNLEEAENILLTHKFDMIVLDLNLPDGNGIQLLKWLNKNQIQTKVFIFSTSIELKRLCLKNGAYAFFDKSQDFDVLMNTILSCSSNDDNSIS